MKTNRLYAVAAVMLLAQACGPQGAHDGDGQSAADTASTAADSNGGIPLDNIERKTDADTLKQQNKNSTGVPMGNIDRDDEKNDSTGQPQRTPD